MATRGVAVLALGPVLVACSGGGRHAASTTSAPIRQQTAAACVLVQLAEATKVFGRSAAHVAVANAGGAQSVCGFEANSTPDTTDLANVTYSLRVYVYDGTQTEAQLRPPDATPIAGLGDDGFSYPRGNELDVLFVARGQTVLLTYSQTAIGRNIDVSGGRDTIVAAARTAASRMP